MTTDIPIERRVAQNYPTAFYYYYSLNKVKLDPAYGAVARLLEGITGPVLDVGCGAGLLAAFLRESGIQLPIQGIDLASNKIALARRLVGKRYPDVTFDITGATDVDGFRGNVVMLDVLHYFSNTHQRELLEKLASLTAPGSLLIIRTTFKDKSWRYWATVIEECFVRLSRWIEGGDWNFPKREFIETCFEDLGIPCAIWPLWGATPFNSYLIVARKP